MFITAATDYHTTVTVLESERNLLRPWQTGRHAGRHWDDNVGQCWSVHVSRDPVDIVGLKRWHSIRPNSIGPSAVNVDPSDAGFMLLCHSIWTTILCITSRKRRHFRLCNNVLMWLQNNNIISYYSQQTHNRHNKYITPILFQYTQTYKHFDIILITKFFAIFFIIPEEFLTFKTWIPSGLV